LKNTSPTSVWCFARAECSTHGPAAVPGPGDEEGARRIRTTRLRGETAIEVTIRKAGLADVPLIARIWHTGWNDGHVGHVPPALLPYRQQEHFEARTPPRIPHTWVAEAEDQVVGFVVVKGDEVEQLFVEREARGTGVAAMRLQKGEGEIRRAGYSRAWLAVVEGNTRARAFYARCGWRDCGPFTYMAETTAGSFAVPSHRYEIELSRRAAVDLDL